VGFYWLDYLGIVNVDKMTKRFFHRSSPSVMYASDDEPSLLAKEEFEKAKDLLAERTEELDRREAQITEQEKNITTEREKLDDLRRGIDQDRKRFDEEKNRYKGYQKNVIDLANKLTSMPPKESVAIMLKWEDTLLIDVLRQMDTNAANAGKQSITSYLISLMPKDRASRITYLMTQI
jgi:flagellar protein FlbB